MFRPGVPIRIDSSTADKDTLGSTINVNFSNALNVDGKYVLLSHATVWYSMPNVTPVRSNQQIRFVYDGDTYTVTLLRGLYSVSAINQQLYEYLSNSSDLPDNLIALSADDSTSRINLIIRPAAGVTFSMTFDGTNVLFRDYLGFSGAVSTSADLIREGNAKANLNVDTAILVRCSFASGGYLNSLSGSDCLGIIPLNSEPNSLIKYEPFMPLPAKCNVSHLSSFTITLTNQLGQPLDMFEEDFTLTLYIFDM